MNLEQHLKTICDADSDRDLHAPFTAEIDGRTWTIGSDGKMMFAIGEALGEYKPIAAGLNSRREGITGYIRSALAAKDPIDIDSLRAFAGTPERDQVKDCDQCDGTGSVCSCGECECEHCDGGDVVIAAKARNGWVNGRYCDLNRVASLLAGVSGEVRILLADGDTSPIYFAGDGWIATLMPLRVRPGDSSDTAPRWVIG